MKTFLILVVFMLPSFSVFSAGNDLLEVREAYYLAVDNEESLKAFEVLLVNFNNPDNTILGYIGMSFMLKAKYAWLPNDKWEYFNKGKKFLESAISKDPNNIELKFMRFCIQNNTPGILRYNKNLEKDKGCIFKAFSGIADDDLKLRISNYMIIEKIELTDAELNTLSR